MKWETLLNTERRRKSNRADSEHRSEFQRDYDRALFSSPVRRLQDKAQVFPLERNDSIRTRLTHSHEVSNIARGLAERVVNHKDCRLPDIARSSIPTMSATVGLLHDLGNPPFGHAGEQAIKEWFAINPHVLDRVRQIQPHGDQMVKDFTEFEGNAQTMRIVTRLQVLTDDNGLNLTYGTLSALRKYVARSNGVDKLNAAMKKPGYFFSENDRIAEIEQKTGCSGVRHPVAVLCEAADDIAYTFVDLEDGITKRATNWRDFSEFASASGLSSHIKDAEDQLKASAFSDALSPQQRDSFLAQVFRTAMIGVFIEEVANAFAANYDDILSGSLQVSLLEKTASYNLLKQVKQFDRDHIYSHSPVLKLELQGRQVIHDLLSIFWSAVQVADASGPRQDLMPKTEGDPLHGLMPLDFRIKAWRLLSLNFKLIYKQAYCSVQNCITSMSAATP